MEEKKKGLIAWIKAHKKQLLLAGISVTVIIGVVIGLKNKDAIIDIWEFLGKRLKKTPEKLPEVLNMTQLESSISEEATSVRLYTPPQEAFDVRQHIRTLPEGRHHSAEKAAEATALGIDLLPNQTLVGMYTKYAA